jgi:hypothetical protein
MHALAFGLIPEGSIADVEKRLIRNGYMDITPPDNS